MKAHFVTFLSPGTFVCEETTKPIESWDTKEAVKMSKKITERYGAKPFVFVFSTRERGDKDLDSKTTKTSGRYFLGGKVLTLADVEKQKEALASWRIQKQLEEQRIADCVSYFVTDNPITTAARGKGSE